jgi:GntR family transcriptional regulator, transcriptional repressor for pyruvate dehydrogenase complex
MRVVWQALAVTHPSPVELAHALRSRIHHGELGPGDQLPPEREMAEQLGVTRPRLRDALVILEAEGYLVARRGVGGGRFVTGLDAPFRLWASRMQTELDDIVDFRLAIECQAVRFAAERRTAKDLTALARANRGLSKATTPRAYRLADVAFHRGIAAASGSKRLAAAVERARGDLFEPAEELWHDGRAAESLADHERITAAIDERDADVAAVAMAAHVESTRGELRALLATVDLKV